MVKPILSAIKELNARVIACRRCPRLVAHREKIAQAPPARFRGQRYWAKPLPGFGDPKARLLIVGLAPAANGGNRTGRIFTGDESGRWLFRALYQAGLCNQPISTSLDDGLVLHGAYLTAIVRCPPPANRPLPQERHHCNPYLQEELRLLDSRVVVALGFLAWQGFLQAYAAVHHPWPAMVEPQPTRDACASASPGTERKARLPKFAHGAVAPLANNAVLLGSYHPSQQNTFTGRLTREMLLAVLNHAKNRLTRG